MREGQTAVGVGGEGGVWVQGIPAVSALGVKHSICEDGALNIPGLRTRTYDDGAIWARSDNRLLATRPMCNVDRGRVEGGKAAVGAEGCRRSVGGKSGNRAVGPQMEVTTTSGRDHNRPVTFDGHCARRYRAFVDTGQLNSVGV